MLICTGLNDQDGLSSNARGVAITDKGSAVTLTIDIPEAFEMALF